MLKMPVRQTLLCCLLISLPAPGLPAGETSFQGTLAELEARIEAYVPDPRYRDDAYGLIMVKDAMTSLKEGSGGIAACLVDGDTGQVVERGRNRQYNPYFRSDLHAEMDLLNRYENRTRKRGSAGEGIDPRQCGNLILYSSVEPCPMCLTRIINAGIRRMYYISPDLEGGMVRHMNRMPKFWREFAAGRDFGQAECSPALQRIAADLFSYSMRGFPGNKVLNERAEKKPALGVGTGQLAVGNDRISSGGEKATLRKGWPGRHQRVFLNNYPE